MTDIEQIIIDMWEQGISIKYIIPYAIDRSNKDKTASKSMAAALVHQTIANHIKNQKKVSQS